MANNNAALQHAQKMAALKEEKKAAAKDVKPVTVAEVGANAARLEAESETKRTGKPVSKFEQRQMEQQAIIAMSRSIAD